MSLINITDLTTEDLEGTGIFDILMNATKIHIKEEFDANRVTGSDYAKMYSAAITQVLQQSIQFVLNKEINGNQADLLAAQTSKIAKDESLVDEEILNKQQETELTEAPVSVTYAQIEDTVFIKATSTAVLGTIAKEKAKIDQEILLSAANVALTDTRELTERAATQDDISTVSPGAVSGVIGKQKSKMDQETANLLEDFSNIALMGNKLSAEKLLLDQRTATELMQTTDTNSFTGSSTAARASGTGILGRQMLLFEEQIEGFQRDAEQKAAKIISDVWSVYTTVDVAALPVGYAESDMTALLDVMATGVGVTPSP